MNSAYVLDIRGISKSFPGVKALDNVSIKIKAGTVHALMGENGAGKSTLMKCIFGLYSPDEGEIVLDGKTVSFAKPREALDSGISMIQQELQPVRHQSVMENVWLGRYPEYGFGIFKLVNHKKMKDDTQKLFDELNIDIDVKKLVKYMSVSQMQLMEIARAVSYNSKIVFMDEPTSSLTESEVEHLFKIIKKLTDNGVAVVYVSHKMDEILKISNEVSIMRDGQFVGTYDAKTLTTETIIAKMVGREMTNVYPPREKNITNVMLEVRNLTSTNEKSFKNISFDLRCGEILGVGGLVGAQKTESVEAIFGLRSTVCGEIMIKGKRVAIKSPIDAKKHGIALLTEERRATGIFPILSISDNSIMANLSSYAKKIILDEKQIYTDVQKVIKDFRVKTPNEKTFIKNLSGGNQQKVLLGRWLLTSPEILILDEPTRGIDVGAKYEIYELMNELVNNGKSVIMISSEMPELLGMSDRIMVMCNGKVTGILDAKDASQEKIMDLATKF